MVHAPNPQHFTPLGAVEDYLVTDGAGSAPRGDMDYEVLLDDGEATVCSAAPKDTHRSTAYQSEAELEEAFLQQLESQAYERVSFDSEAAMVANLRAQLEALNGMRFSDGEWERFFKKSIAGANDGIVEKTRRIQEDHIQPLTRDDGSTKNVRLIDKRNVHNNRLQVMHQYGQEGARANRYDVTVLVNGLPLVHVELKRRGVSIREAFNQIERYQRDSFWAGSGLYEYVQVFVISNGTETKYYSNTTRCAHVHDRRKPGQGRRGKQSDSFEFTSWWAAADNEPIRDLVPFTRIFFSKHTLLSILTRYCVFTEDEQLMVMRPYQIVATERILNRVLVSEANKQLLGTKAAGGYVWHTTGSGKTLTSFKAAKLAAEMEGVDKVLFVVDRKDLDYQTMREYDKFEKGAVDGSKNTAVLAAHLADPSKRILVTTIQKLDSFIKRNPKHPVYGGHVVIIFDECHRSQFGSMHKAITKHFKNYHLFGFTGTPIFAENAGASSDPHLATTAQAFGDMLHAYTIVDATRDGNVLPFRVEYYSTIKERAGMRDEEVYAIDTRGAFQDKNRAELVVRYILEHFDQKTKRSRTYQVKDRRVRGFNSLFAVESIDMAKVYYSAFKRVQAETPGDGIKVGLIYSFGPNDADDGCGLPDESFDVESLDTPDRDFLEGAIADYNAMFGTSFSTGSGPDGFENYYKDISQRLKHQEIDLVIVVNMFLTGFDAKTLNTLWLDKNLKQHGLIQAFSRTNRILNSVKTYGNVVSFRDLQDEVNESLSLFGDKEAGGLVLLRPYEEYLAEYRNRLAQLYGMFPVGELIVGEEAEREFVRLFGVVLRLRNVLTSFDEFAADDPMPPRDEQDYHSEYGRLYDKYRRSREDPTLVNGDLEFEVELLRSVDVGIDYILMLVRKYHDSHCQDKEVVADVERALASSYELRSKRDLVEAFIDSLESSEDVDADWRAYIARKLEEELEELVAEEALDDAKTREFLGRAFAEGEVPEEGTEVAALMTKRPSRFAPSGAYGEMKRRVLERLKAYFERFYGLGA